MLGMKKLLALVLFSGCVDVGQETFDRCAEALRVCEGTLGVVCGQDDRFCPSDSPVNQAARSPVLVYCADAYEACLASP